MTNAIALDDTVGLHPNLAKLAARYQAGHVAIVEGVGYPDPNLSHFASLAYWWAGTPGESGAVGWLGRYLDGTVGFDDPLAAVGIGPIPSPALLGTRSFATSITDASGLQPSLPAWAHSADDLIAAWSRFAPATPDPSSLLGQVQQAIKLTADARHDLTGALAGASATETGPADDLAPDSPQNAAQAAGAGGYRRSASVTDSLRLAAQLIASDHAPRVIYVSGLGDYDTHQGQAQRHPLLMTDLDAGIDAFFTTLDAAGATDRALLMTVSEFGRRGRERQWHRSRCGGAPLLHRRGRQGRALRRTAVAHQARREGQPRAFGRLPRAVRHRRPGLARRRGRGDRREGLRTTPGTCLRRLRYRARVKFGIFYEHQLPRPWDDDSEQRLIRDALEQCELADHLGIDYVWEVEHHFLEEYSHSSAPEVFLAAVSQRTRRIRLGHGIVQTPPSSTIRRGGRAHRDARPRLRRARRLRLRASRRRKPSSAASSSIRNASVRCGKRVSGWRCAASRRPRSPATAVNT